MDCGVWGGCKWDLTGPELAPVGVGVVGREPEVSDQSSSLITISSNEGANLRLLAAGSDKIVLSPPREANLISYYTTIVNENILRKRMALRGIIVDWV